MSLHLVFLNSLDVYCIIESYCCAVWLLSSWLLGLEDEKGSHGCHTELLRVHFPLICPRLHLLSLDSRTRLGERSSRQLGWSSECLRKRRNEFVMIAAQLPRPNKHTNKRSLNASLVCYAGTVYDSYQDASIDEIAIRCVYDSGKEVIVDMLLLLLESVLG